MSSFTNGADAVATASGTSLSVSSTVADGENIVVLVGYTNATTIVESVSDGVNTFTELSSTLTGSGNAQWAMFEARNVTGGTRNITFTLATAATNRLVAYGRVAGVQDVAAQVARQQQASPGTGTNAITSGNITPSLLNGRMVGMTITNSAASISAGSSFNNAGTLANIESTLGLRTRVEDRDVTSASAAGATFTASSGPTLAWSFAWYYREAFQAAFAKGINSVMAAQ